MALVSFRIDDTLKATAEDMFHSMGMSMSAAIHIFITQAVRKQRFPFPIEADPFYSESNLSVLRRRADDMDAGKKVLMHDVMDAEESVHA